MSFEYNVTGCTYRLGLFPKSVVKTSHTSTELATCVISGYAVTYLHMLSEEEQNPHGQKKGKISSSCLLEEMLINYKYTMYYMISSVTEIDWNE